MTPHIEASQGEYASTVLMPGDPLRAKWIAETFLQDVKLVNTVRNCLGYTGYFNNKLVSVQASGMGQASLAIYATELFKFYNVENIIRVGTCGGFHSKMNTGELVLALTASTDSNLQLDSWIVSPCCDFNLLNNVIKQIENKNYMYHIGAICSTDQYYNDNENWWRKFKDYNMLGVDMETYQLYLLAMKYNKKALTVNTVSNNLVTKKELSSTERERGLNSMIEVVLNSL
jgi:purine-nucleoside phosphorylase